MSRLKAADKAFISYVKEECKKYGVKCDIRDVKSVEADGVTCSGYFNESDKTLVVAMKAHNSLGLLVHEYCHMTQWIDGIAIWKLATKSLDKMHEWLEGKSVKNIRYHLGIVREMELDNERRSVQMIKKWNLSVDVKEYVREANSYVQLYNWMYHSRIWPAVPPYRIKAITASMSDRFNMGYRRMSKKVFNTFHAAYIKHTDTQLVN
jgi:hypothetical protein